MIYQLVKDNQTNIMMALMGICLILVLFLASTNSINKKIRSSLISMGLGVAAMLFFNRLAYIYEGKPGRLVYFIVRVGNFFAYSMILIVIYIFSRYIDNLLSDRASIKLKRFKCIYGLSAIGELLIIISQFTGFYYTIDANNIYHRSTMQPFSYVFPFIAIFINISIVVQFRKSLPKRLYRSILAFLIIPLSFSIVQAFFYGLLLTDLALAIFVILLYYTEYMEINKKAHKVNNVEVQYYEKEQRKSKQLFEQTAEALANAIDAKDEYTRGHSSRVAEYSRELARLGGKTEKECEEVYYAALLHDVGKIGIPGSILNKKGKLTPEEYEIVKKHPEIGNNILMGITKFPYLSIGAHYHHERYDGKGYPDRLKGEDIPEIARIIAVADAYDAMTSKRSYRSTIPQEMVGEEILKGSGTQFDPKYAAIMKTMIDNDIEYTMREKEELDEFAGKSDMYCEDYRDNKSMGIKITEYMVNIEMRSTPTAEGGIPSLILFDSLDGRIHDDDDSIKDEMMYIEYGEIKFDGNAQRKSSRKIKTKREPSKTLNKEIYTIQAVKYSDHVMITIDNGSDLNRFIIALPDSTRYTYFAITGKKCHITNVKIKRKETAITENDIPRIAKYISFINGPEGNIPSIQIDNHRSTHTEPIPILGNTRISFHSKSLYPARLIWHCPYICIYSSDDKQINGPNYKEYGLIRIDGEPWKSDYADVNLTIDKTDAFNGWADWKKKNKEGIDCTVYIRKNNNLINIETNNCGINIKCNMLLKENKEVYAALTGDQCVLTNIIWS